MKLLEVAKPVPGGGDGERRRRSNPPICAVPIRHDGVASWSTAGALVRPLRDPASARIEPRRGRDASTNGISR